MAFESLTERFQNIFSNLRGKAKPVSYTHLDVYKRQDIDKLQKTIGYTFKNADLLTLALTHPSYSSEAGLERYKSCLLDTSQISVHS